MATQVNLGCGKLHKRGYLNVDIRQPADLVFDITRGALLAPLRGTVDLIEADNLLEHFDNDEFLRAMNNIHTTLATGGRFWFKVPDALNWPDGAYGDPTHKRFFVPRSFLYFDITQPQWKNYGSHYGFLGWTLLGLHSDMRFFTCTLQKP